MRLNLSQRGTRVMDLFLFDVPKIKTFVFILKDGKFSRLVISWSLSFLPFLMLNFALLRLLV